MGYSDKLSVIDIDSGKDATIFSIVICSNAIYNTLLGTLARLN